MLNGAGLQLATNLQLLTNIALAQGGAVAGLGISNAKGLLTIDPAATAVSLGTVPASDIFRISDGSYELSGIGGDTRHPVRTLDHADARPVPFRRVTDGG